MYKIYQLTSPSGKSYIGQTNQNIQKRFYQHVNMYKKWVKDNRPRKTYIAKLMYAFDKYEPETWTVKELQQTVDQNQRDYLEQSYIKLFNTIENGYNIQNGGQGWRESKLANEHKNNISISRKEYLETEEGKNHINNMKIIMKGNIHSKGKEAWNKGKICPSISEGRRKNPTVYKPEDHEKRSRKTKNMWEKGIYDNRPPQSKETRQKQADSKRGFKQSDYQKQCAAKAREETYQIKWDTGNKETITNLSEFVRTSGICQATLSLLLREKRGSKKWGIVSLEKIS